MNALLVLSHMAVKMGDRIRIVAFDDRIRGDFLSSKSGKSLEKIRDFLAPLQPEFVESDYGHLFTHLHKTLNKRSLVILLSDLTDSVNYKLLRHHFTLLSRKHSLVFLLLRDKLMNKESEYTAKNQEEIYRVTAARSLLLERHDTLKRLERTGIHILDLMPQEVTARLVDKYLQLKGENRI